MTGNEMPSKDQILGRLGTVIDPDLKMEIACEFSKVAHGVASALSVLARKGSGPAS